MSVLDGGAAGIPVEIDSDARSFYWINEPEYEWASSDESQAVIEAIRGTNQAVAARVDPAGETVVITLGLCHTKPGSTVAEPLRRFAPPPPLGKGRSLVGRD